MEDNKELKHHQDCGNVVIHSSSGNYQVDGLRSDLEWRCHVDCPIRKEAIRVEVLKIFPEFG